MLNLVDFWSKLVKKIFLVKKTKFCPIVRISDRLKFIFTLFSATVGQNYPKIGEKFITIRCFLLISSKHWKNLHYGPISRKLHHRIFSNMPLFNDLRVSTIVPSFWRCAFKKNRPKKHRANFRLFMLLCLFVPRFKKV
jgi:hypothetical protein